MLSLAPVSKFAVKLEEAVSFQVASGRAHCQPEPCEI
jgi:hypothetical protein